MVVVLATSVELVQLLVEYCHFRTLPTLPERVSVVEFVPEQTVVPPAIEPPTETGSTEIVASEELVSAQTPL